MRSIFFILGLFISSILMAQDKPAYLIYDKDGKSVDYQSMLKAAGKNKVVFFGELHNNPIAHWLQIELTQDLFEATEGKLALGAEMFERDNQLLIDEYFAGSISQKNFEEEVRLWNNYKTDYKPLVEFAKTNGLPFVASNVPRRYANLVFREGIEALDQLSDAAKEYLAPLPIEIDLELPGYKAMMEMMASHSEGNIKFPQAQAIKDATMAHSINEHLDGVDCFIHYNGAYHSDNYEGILWYLNQYRPGQSILTIKTSEQEDISKLDPETKGSADFIICIPASMTKTY